MKKQARNLSNSTKNRKTARLALFSENERRYLKGKQEYSNVMKSKFHKDLDHRFNALIEDLEMMQSSSKLQLWKIHRSFKYDQYFRRMNYFSNLFPHAEVFYVNALRQIKIKKGVYKYWQDNTPLDDIRIDKRSFEPGFFFRHCRNLLNDPNDEKAATRKTLLEAFHHQGILPTKKEDAITFEEIKNRLAGKSKIRSNIKQITRDEFYKQSDPRNREIDKIVDVYTKKLNKKLAELDSRVTRVIFSPNYH